MPPTKLATFLFSPTDVALTHPIPLPPTELLPSGGNTNKMHNHSHFTTDVKLIGHPQECSANFKNAYAKTLYRWLRGATDQGCWGDMVGKGAPRDCATDEL